jgi:hypothetical protein
VGNLHRRARERFASEECVAAEKAIHIFLSNPNIFKDKFLRPVRFLGGVEFQPDWIVQGSLESIWMFPRASRMSDAIYVGDFLGSATTGTATNTKGETIRVESVATQIRGLAVDARAPANIWAILEGFSADAKGKKGLALYRGSVGSLSAREVALRNANKTGSDILDKTERGKLLINEEVMDAVRDLLVKFYQLQGLGCLAAIGAAHRAIGPEPDYPAVAGQRPPQLH